MGGERYALVEHSGDLAIRVHGPDEAGCHTAAVRGFAAAAGAVDPEAHRRSAPVAIPGATPVERLVGLLQEAIARLDAEGELAVDLLDPSVGADRLQARLVLVPLAAVEIAGPPPKAVTWHATRLGPAEPSGEDGDGWEGLATIDL